MADETEELLSEAIRETDAELLDNAFKDEPAKEQPEAAKAEPEAPKTEVDPKADPKDKTEDDGARECGKVADLSGPE